MSRSLTTAAVLVTLVAIVHVGAIFVGPAAWRYLDAAPLAELAEAGSALPAVLTLGVAGALMVFAAYAWSGAGRMRALPQLQRALWVIGGIFTLRGLGVVWFSWLVLSDSPEAIPREIGFSLVSLGIGLAYLVGAAARGRDSAH